MFWYAIASLTPAVLLTLACALGGAFPAFAVASITVVVFFLDKLPVHLPNRATQGRGLNYTLVAVHMMLLVIGIWTLAHGMHLSALDKILIFAGIGLYFGQVSNSNAHELIHASTRSARRLGTAVYITLLHGHHVSAHLRVHHVHAATDRDPNSARPGEGFWHYCLRVVRGEFRQGLRADTEHRKRLTPTPPSLTHPYVAYVAGSAVALILTFTFAGIWGVLAHLGIAAYAQLQLLLSDYVQHYGLRRRTLASGKTEPVGPEHSWNAPPWFSSAMMLNAPRHSDHHLHPARAFPALDLDPKVMPILPHSLPVMAVIALFPPLWRRVMDRRVAHWREPA